MPPSKKPRAKAPRPGVTRRAEAESKSTEIVTIAFRGEVHTLAHNMVPLREKLAYLRQVGESYEKLTFRGELYVESIAPLVWLARRAAGEFDLSFAEFEAEWPADLRTSEITMTVDVPDEDAEDPEA